MKKWMKNFGIVSAIAAVSVLSFAAVAFAQVETQTPTAVPGIVERVQNGVRGEFGGPGGERGSRGGEVDAAKEANLAQALGLTVEELQAAKDAGQTLEEIATAQGLDLETVKAELNAARLAAIQADVAERVAAGEITQAQADEILLRAETGPARGGERGGQRGGHPSFADATPEAQATLAGVLNLSVEDLQAAIDTGQHIDEIADAQGVDMADVKAVMDEFRLANLESHLAEKVTAGELTQAEADAILEQAQNGDFPGRGGRHGHPGGPRGEAPEGTFPGGTNFQAPTFDDSNL